MGGILMRDKEKGAVYGAAILIELNTLHKWHMLCQYRYKTDYLSLQLTVSKP